MKNIIIKTLKFISSRLSYFNILRLLRQKIKYIYNNPVRKKYVAKPEDWLYSSARNRILDDNSMIELDSPWG